MALVIVTGASRGIGRAIALRLSRPSREMVLVGRDAAALESVAADARSRSAQALVAPADLTDAAAVAALAGALPAGPIEAVVHNAGVAVVKPIGDVSPEEFGRSLATMVTAPFLLTRALLPRLEKGASLVHVLSIAARRGFPGWSAYCAAKFGLEGLSQSLREELRPRGVRVINVYPAATATALWDGVTGEWPRDRMLDPAEVAEAVAYALDRPSGVAVETIEVGDVSGAL
ncbi:MAG: SDR family oxidoreductase [Acidobacteriota bacterium]